MKNNAVNQSLQNPYLNFVSKENLMKFGRLAAITMLVLSTLIFTAAALSFLGARGYLPSATVLIKNSSLVNSLLKVSSAVGSISLLMHLFVFSNHQKSGTSKKNQASSKGSENALSKENHALNNLIYQEVLNPSYHGEPISFPEYPNDLITPFTKEIDAKNYISDIEKMRKFCQDSELNLLQLPEVQYYTSPFTLEGETHALPCVIEKEIPPMNEDSKMAFQKVLNDAENVSQRDKLKKAFQQLMYFIVKMNLKDIGFNNLALSKDNKIVLVGIDKLIGDSKVHSINIKNALVGAVKRGKSLFGIIPYMWFDDFSKYFNDELYERLSIGVRLDISDLKNAAKAEVDQKAPPIGLIG